MSKKLTPWFPKNKKPHRAGVYETRINFSIGGTLNRYQHWNGRRWGAFATSVREARGNMHFASAYQDNKWRGLTERP